MFWTVLYVILEVLIAISALVGNIFVIILFLYDERLKINRNFYLISLAFANILVCVLEIPFTIFTYFGLPYDSNTLCYLELSIICLTRTLINYAIAAIALDRLKAVTHPYEYRNNNSTFSSFIIIGICWAIALIIGFLTMLWEVEGDECNFSRIHPYHIIMCHTLGKMLPYIIVVGCYGFIFWSIWKVLKNKNLNGTSSIKSRSRLKAERREIRATLKITWIVGILTICEMPINVTNILLSFGLIDISKFLHFAFLVLAHTHVAINPFLYALNLSDFKRATQKMFKRDEMDSSIASKIHQRNLEVRRSNIISQSDTDQ